MMRTEVAMITPEIAEQYLQSNAAFQRQVRWGTVKKLESAMLRGEWKLTHQGIAFDTNGKLVDGQHRLLAVRRCGVSVPMSVSFGVDPTCFKVLDIGAKRNMADLLRIGTREAAIISFLAGKIASRNSTAQCSTLYDTIGDKISNVIAAGGATKNVFQSSPVQSAVVFSLISKPEEEQRILQLYKDVAQLNIDLLPPIGAAMIRQCFTSGGKSDLGDKSRAELFCRTVIMLDETKRDCTALRLQAVTAAAIQTNAREAIRGIIEAPASA